jgi:hypothetical protein
MKASEIFLSFARPLQEATPATGIPSEVELLLKIPALVWNATVLDRNMARKKGELPKLLRDHLPNLPVKDREMTKALLEFWVKRKDQLYSEHNWPIDIEVYKNVKSEVIVRVLVRQPKHFNPDLPAEWGKSKGTGEVLPLNVLANRPRN